MNARFFSFCLNKYCTLKELPSLNERQVFVFCCLLFLPWSVVKRSEPASHEDHVFLHNPGDTGRRGLAWRVPVSGWDAQSMGFSHVLPLVPLSILHMLDPQKPDPNRFLQQII